MYYYKDLLKLSLKYIVCIVLSLTVGFICGDNFTENETEIIPEVAPVIELSETQVEAEVEYEDGTVESFVAPTVTSIDGVEFDDENQELGQGAAVDISSIESFKNAVLGQCIDVDGYWGAQCVDGFAYFNLSYTGRWLSTAGTKKAKGLWDAREENAGNDYELIYNVNDIVAGTWVVWGSGTNGHVGLALSGVHDGYITVLGENQGGAPCPGGGSSFNIINLSTRDFLGGFLPIIWKSSEPVLPEIPNDTSNIQTYEVKKGDTLSQIMLELEGEVDYAKMNDYARSWKSTKINPEQVVYDGWHSATGVGLYAGDIIERI